MIEEKEVEEKEDKKYDDEEIVAQSVEKGKTLRTGDEIILYIPKVLEKYPDFVNENWSITDIQNWAKEKEKPSYSASEISYGESTLDVCLEQVSESIPSDTHINELINQALGVIEKGAY